MAIIRSNVYPGRFDAPTADQPQGAFKNRTAADAKDGSYLEQQWLNDWSALFSALLEAANLAPNGQVDKVGASQYFDALKAVITDTIPTGPGSGLDADLVRGLPADFQSVKDLNGRQVIAGNVKILWQRVTVDTEQTLQTFNFHVPFDSYAYNITATINRTSFVTGAVGVYANILSKSQFQIMVDPTQLSGQPVDVYIQAIGF